MSLQDGKQCPHCNSYDIMSDHWWDRDNLSSTCDENGKEYWICHNCATEHHDHQHEKLYFTEEFLKANKYPGINESWLITITNVANAGTFKRNII